MIGRRFRYLTLFAIAFSTAMLASNQAHSQSPLVKKMRSVSPDPVGKPIGKAPSAAVARIRNWHVGDSFPTDRFGQHELTLERDYDPDKPVPYFDQQVKELKKPQWVNGDSEPSMELRRRAVDYFKGLGPKAVDAVPTLFWSAAYERDGYVRRTAMEILIEYGGMLPVVAASETLLNPRIDDETAKAAEESLLKLLPTVAVTLTRNDSLYLYKVHNWGNPRVATAIESAWATRGITRDDLVAELDWIAKESARLAKEEELRIARELKAKAAKMAQDEQDRLLASLQAVRKLNAQTEIQALCVKLLHPGNDLEGAKAAEESLLMLLPTIGSRLNPRDAIFLDDVRRAGNQSLSRPIRTALNAGGFKEYFDAREQYIREHGGEESSGKVHIRDLPENWQRFLMTPQNRPDFSRQLFNGPVGDGLSNAERRRLEIDRQNRERAANRVR